MYEVKPEADGTPERISVGEPPHFGLKSSNCTPADWSLTYDQGDHKVTSAVESGAGYSAMLPDGGSTSLKLIMSLANFAGEEAKGQISSFTSIEFQPFTADGSVRLIRLQTEMGSDAAPASTYFATVKVKSTPADPAIMAQSDQVQIKHYGCNIKKVQYSTDNQTWTDVTTTPIEVQRRHSLLFRVIKLSEGTLWPDRPVRMPVWDWNGVTYNGDNVSFTFDHATGPDEVETLNAVCGNTVPVKVKVLPMEEDSLPR